MKEEPGEAPRFVDADRGLKFHALGDREWRWRDAIIDAVSEMHAAGIGDAATTLEILIRVLHKVRNPLKPEDQTP